MPGIFSAFRSTVTPYWDMLISSSDRWLVDNVTGAIVGVKNSRATGPDARFTPVDITAAQATAPSAAMVADLDATFRLNVPPYTRYQSDGAVLIPVGSATQEVVIPYGFNTIYYDPLTIRSPEVLVVQGTIHVEAYPA